MNGAGNDFVVLDNRTRSLLLDQNVIARLCERHRGIGADGLLALEPSEGAADFRMRYYNSDGGEAEMCGNGARCFARFAARAMPEKPSSLNFETQAGLITAFFEGELVTLDMGVPTERRDAQPVLLGGAPLHAHFINTGVPHAVVFVSDVETIDIQRLGSELRWHELFSPKGTNANFAQVVAPRNLVLRTFERGVEGETLACGTGVCAAALVHALDAGVSSPVHVKVRGGDTLRVDFKRSSGGGMEGVRLTGPADFVFEGTISL